MAKNFTAEFKLEAAKLVVDHGYTYAKAAERIMSAILLLPAMLISFDLSGV
ncbi:TPA: transposase [Raoultella ornithinolytica]|nr:transposase [Raoultella ornithinolytica]HAT1671246.1 transposase [Raoultella ornithinolytica]